MKEELRKLLELAESWEKRADIAALRPDDPRLQAFAGTHRGCAEELREAVRTLWKETQ